MSANENREAKQRAALAETLLKRIPYDLVRGQAETAKRVQEARDRVEQRRKEINKGSRSAGGSFRL